VTTIAEKDEGIIDGIKVERAGSYIVSHWEGRIYRVTADGESDLLIDSTVPGVLCADFEYLDGSSTIVVPTFYDNRLVGYRLLE